jgi:hypothetical protein
MVRGAGILAFLMIAHAVAAGAFWAFLNVPESSIWMLLLSGFLALGIVTLTGWTEGTAAAAWRRDLGIGEAMRRGLQAVPGFFGAVVVFALFWWGTEAIWRWKAAYSGQIDAWLMSRFATPNTAWVHRAVDIALFILRYILGLSVAVGILSAAATAGSREILRGRWIKTAVSRRQIGAIGLAVVLLIALPLRAAYWRPEGLPPTTLEIAFTGGKLAFLYVVVNLGWSLVLRAAARSALTTRT